MRKSRNRHTTNEGDTPLFEQVRKDLIKKKNIDKLRKSKKDSFNARQKLFCERYVVHFNGSKAAVEAGYSEASKYQIACDLMAQDHIKLYINKLKADCREHINYQKHDQLNHLLQLRDKLMNEDSTENFNIILKIDDMLNKLLGLYEAEKVKMDMSFKLTFNGYNPDEKEMIVIPARDQDVIDLNLELGLKHIVENDPNVDSEREQALIESNERRIRDKYRRENPIDSDDEFTIL